MGLNESIAAKDSAVNENRKDTVSDVKRMFNKVNGQKTILPDTDDTRAISEVEKLLAKITGELSDLNELKPVIEELCDTKQDFVKEVENDINKRVNGMTNIFEELKKKLECEVDYSRELSQKILLIQKEHEVTILEKKLIDTESKINDFIETTNKYVVSKIDVFEEKINSLKTVEDIIEDNIDKFNQHVNSAATSEFLALKGDCSKLLKDYTKQCQFDLEVMKKKSIDFIKDCEAQNKEIISKIPKVNNNKYSLKDILIYIFCGISIIGNILMVLNVVK